MLECINVFLQRVKPDTGMHMDFSIGSGGKSYNGLFKEDGLAGILEAKDIYTVDNISSCISAKVNRYCDKERESPVTDVLVRYVELLRLVYCSNGTVGWTDDDADILRKQVMNLKARRTEFLSEY